MSEKHTLSKRVIQHANRAQNVVRKSTGGLLCVRVIYIDVMESRSRGFLRVYIYIYIQIPTDTPWHCTTQSRKARDLRIEKGLYTYLWIVGSVCAGPVVVCKPPPLWIVLSRLHSRIHGSIVFICVLSAFWCVFWASLGVCVRNFRTYSHNPRWRLKY